jgi:hypothetical protein
LNAKLETLNQQLGPLEEVSDRKRIEKERVHDRVGQSKKNPDLIVTGLHSPFFLPLVLKNSRPSGAQNSMSLAFCS